MFTSEGTRCVGHLYRAAGSGGHCVVLCTGFGGTQDTPALLATAQDFARAGYHALTFDYRSFGLSDGRPRQVVSIAGQLADIAAAVACARGLDGVDPSRVVLWGTSLGGGHVITAASRDPDVAAVVAQIPFNGFPRKVEGRSVAATLRLLGAMVSDWLRGKLRMAPRYLPAIGGRGEFAVMASAEAHRVIAGMDSPTWRNEVAPRALLEMMRYRPAGFAPRVACPVLVCIGDRDAETPPELSGALAEAVPHGELKTYPVPHFDFYTDAVRPQVVADQIEFLRRVSAT